MQPNTGLYLEMKVHKLSLQDGVLHHRKQKRAVEVVTNNQLAINS